MHHETALSSLVKQIHVLYKSSNLEEFWLILVNLFLVITLTASSGTM